MITQADLSTYRLLKANAEAAEAAVKAQRDVILAGYSDGVEPGPCKLKVETRHSQTFSYLAMVDIVGMAKADEIKARLPSRPTTVVIVTGA